MVGSHETATAMSVNTNRGLIAALIFFGHVIVFTRNSRVVSFPNYFGRNTWFFFGGEINVNVGKSRCVPVLKTMRRTMEAVAAALKSW